MMVIYNPDNPVTSKWEIVREYTGNGQITFSITDTGQVRFTTSTLGGVNHAGLIGFAASTLDQS